MMPLWTTATSPPERCGCALSDVGAPCVAQRVCEMPVVAVRCSASACAARSATRAVDTRRSRTGLAPPSTTASPVESYPRYSRRRIPSIRIGTTLRFDVAPTMPHMVSPFLSRPLPARNGNLRSARDGQLIRGRFLHDRAAAADRRAGPDRDRRDEHAIGSNVDVVADDRA